MEKLRKNDVYTVTIDGYTSEGLGVCRVDGAVIFVNGAIDGEVCVKPDQGNALDLAWAAAKHAAAVEHVLTKTALSCQSRDVYSALSKDGRTISDVASAFGISENLVRQIKFRVEQRIGVVEAEMVEDEKEV